MFTINNIYFDGNSYANWLKNNKKELVSHCVSEAGYDCKSEGRRKK